MRSASKCVRRSHCAVEHTPTATRQKTHLSGCRADSIHTATPDATKQSCLCRVWCGDTVLSCRKSNSYRGSGHDTVKTVLSCRAWRCELAFSEWLLLRRCNLSNIGGRVYVRVRVRVSVRVFFQHYLICCGHGHLCLTGCSVVTIATA